ncbi:MAG: hypothetical protein HQ582_01740 [Planctomycetes bacterium]|nr:hypothetical protein [Planctomycetota bacterium]
MIDRIFDACVWLLVQVAWLTGMTYKEINVWIFCVIWPLLTLGLIVLVVVQWRGLRKLKQDLQLLRRWQQTGERETRL